ncbi:MAG TPA: HD-GYP domain-containing protein [Gemmatimonadales bacterium]|nr:HD-GYP domain-containing protein [Gemmatimonadales bacterium]
MPFNRAVKTYVTGISVSALLLLGGSFFVPGPELNLWALGSLLLVGCLLEVSRTQNKSGGLTGSLVFVFHLAVGLILGVFWGALTAGVVKAIAQVFDRSPVIKSVFNVAERVVSVGLTFLVYAALGGSFPPAFVDPATSSQVAFNTALLEIGIFLAAALVYFVTNSIAVNAVVALASERPIVSTWRANTVWVLGYDLAASSLALLVAWLFLLSNQSNGLARLAFMIVVLPLIMARHIYGKLNGLEEVYKELDRAYEELEQNVREQLAMMVKAIEARDPYTSGHSRRVSGLSSAIARDLGLPVEEVEQIENAALLHDVGKIHEEFAPLLQKEGKLNDEEWAVMKTHSIKSAELVSLFSRFQGYVVSCVRHHHERWDGKGYPDQIAGDAIPLGARIIAIADTIDAMTTNRPYRDALPIEAVLSELNRGRNSQFDETLVELTVNSVTVRRLIADPSSIPEHIPQPRSRGRASGSGRGKVV